ncbi:hypothetical protein GCM10010191_56410 [Actinomadura vinacea]|uniref:Asp23/Gls24 family envelope stress response protein n=1 Tax=Actinomadura vinacea TaxID=115336 RepID=A0ABP5WRS9_9ACTN
MTAAGPPPPKGRRGQTTIAERAVARIVRHALDEDAEGAGRGLARGRGPRVDVKVNGETVTARVRMSLLYPEPVREVTNRVRDHVRERVRALTGLTVRQMDIDVAGLERREAIARRERRVVR